MLDYPSHIKQEQFDSIKEDLESARKRTKPRKLDLYDVFCGVLYVLKSGCQWRMLPKDFPKWRSVHEYFRIWSEQREDKPSILEQVLKKLVGWIHIKDGRKEMSYTNLWYYPNDGWLNVLLVG